MAPFKTSILKSTTIEGAFLEVAFMLKELEAATNQAKKKAKVLYDKLSNEEKANVPLPYSGLEETNFLNISLSSDQQRCIVLANLPARIKSNSFGGYFLAKEIFPSNEIADLEGAGIDSLLETL